jgi:SAM-dependent methyltransferase
MAHADQTEFLKLIRKHLPSYFSSGRVLEIGSLDINGSIRSVFSTTDYVGVDVAPGPGVDQVGQGQLLDHPSGTYDAVVSCECLEHNPFWVETVANIFRMTRPGGLVIISCATTGRAEHGTTRSSGSDSPLSIGIGWEYYKNISLQDFRRTFNFDYWFDDYLLLENWDHCDLYFVGIRKPALPAQSIAPLRTALRARFRSTQTLRSACVFLAAKLFGEPGVSALRFLWHLVPRTA